MEQRSTEWHKARLGLITASSVGAILGNSPNGTRDDVMRRMVRDWHGHDPEFTGNIATEYGVNNEAGAIVEYTMETANTVQPIGFVTREDWAGCSPDGMIVGDGGLEVKCPFGLRKDVNPQFKTLADQPHYYDQVQFSLWVTGWKFWHFYQWTPSGKTKLECVLPDLEWQAKNLPILRQFHAEYLHERMTPDAHIAPKCAEFDTPEAHKIMAEYDQLSEAIENAEARKKELLADMVRMAGEKDAIFAGRKLTKTTKAGAVSYAKALAQYAPNADLEPFRGNPSSYWVVK